MATEHRAIFAIKLLHSVIFWILSACVLMIVEGAVAGRATAWTWLAVGLVAADRIFPVCGTTFVIALAVLLVRVIA